MTNAKVSFKTPDLSAFYWQDYRSLLQHLFPAQMLLGEMPTSSVLNSILLPQIQQYTDKPLCFVPAADLPGVDYEQHIYQHGEISTRQDNWHDLFNALVWAGFPQTKVAMNAMHNAEIKAGNTIKRGPVRDALTLFDECGAVVVSDSEQLLRALALRNWQELFCERRSAWPEQLRVFILGHALLEKFLQPYKSITAQVLLYRCDSGFMQADQTEQRTILDALLSRQLQAGQRLRSSTELSPLPLMGIPGWWFGQAQDANFYQDERVFRPSAEGFRRASIHTMGINP